MKKVQTGFLIGLITSCVLLCSCDPSTNHRKIVINNSDYDLVVIPAHVQGEYGYVSDSIFVGRHSQVVIAEMRQISKTKEYKNCHIDSIRTRIADHDSLQLTVNLSNKSNWQYFLLKKELEGGGACDCRIEIRNEHIE